MVQGDSKHSMEEPQEYVEQKKADTHTRTHTYTLCESIRVKCKVSHANLRLWITEVRKAALFGRDKAAL